MAEKCGNLKGRPAYLAISGQNLDDVIKPGMKQEFEQDKYNWFPNETTKESKAYDKRTP
jgi:hypothetical protein